MRYLLFLFLVGCADSGKLDYKVYHNDMIYYCKYKINNFYYDCESVNDILDFIELKEDT